MKTKACAAIKIIVKGDWDSDEPNRKTDCKFVKADTEGCGNQCPPNQIALKFLFFAIFVFKEHEPNCNDDQSNSADQSYPIAN